MHRKTLASGILLLLLVSIVSPVAFGINVDEDEELSSSGQSRDEVYLHYYNPDTTSDIIWLPHGEQYLMTAIRLTNDEISPYIDWDLTKVRMKISTDLGQTEFNARLIIYDIGTSSNPGPIIYEDNSLFYDATGYYDIELTEPIHLNELTELWIALEWEMEPDAEPPVFLDEGPAIAGKGDWIKFGDNEWKRLSDEGLSYNWYIGTIIEGVNELPDLKITGFDIEKDWYSYGHQDYALYCNISNIGGSYSKPFNTSYIITPFFLPFLPLYVRTITTYGLSHNQTLSSKLFVYSEPFIRLYWFHIRIIIDGEDANPLNNQLHRPFLIINENIFPEKVII